MYCLFSINLALYDPLGSLSNLYFAVNFEATLIENFRAKDNCLLLKSL